MYSLIIIREISRALDHLLSISIIIMAFISSSPNQLFGRSDRKDEIPICDLMVPYMRYPELRARSYL